MQIEKVSSVDNMARVEPFVVSYRTRMGRVIAGVLLFVEIGILILVLSDHMRNSDPNETIYIRVILSIICLGGSLIAYRLWKIRIVVTQAGIFDVSIPRTRFVRWDEIETIGKVTEFHGLSGSRVDAIQLTLKNGKALKCDGYAGNAREDLSRSLYGPKFLVLDVVVEQLNGYLIQARATEEGR